jgi:hypothetical protein
VSYCIFKKLLIFSDYTKTGGVIMVKKDKKSIKEDDEKMIAIYHVVYENETFEDAANVIFSLVKDAQKKAPNLKRALYLDIDGHKNNNGGFDHDMYELQKGFILGFLFKFLYEVHIPLGGFQNKEQNNDIPDDLKIIPFKDKELEKYMPAHKEIAASKEDGDPE